MDNRHNTDNDYDDDMMMMTTMIVIIALFSFVFKIKGISRNIYVYTTYTHSYTYNKIRNEFDRQQTDGNYSKERTFRHI